MKKSWRISRRMMLRGMGASLALPLLDVMEQGLSAKEAGVAPTRAAFLYFPNGIAEGIWEPKRVGRNGELLELNEWMSPLQPFRNEIVIPQNMWTPRGNGHGAGTATWLTGHGYDGRRINVGGISVDQIAANEIGQANPLPSIELSTKGEGYFSKSLARNNISWRDEATPCSREVEPRRVFDRIVGRAGGSLINRSLLDQVLADARSLRRKVSHADRQKIDEYLESIRSLERRLEFADVQSTKAEQDKALTETLVRPEPGIPIDHGEYLRLMMDMIVLAFWTNATRVTSFMLDHGQSNRYFNFLNGVKGTWHALSHYRDISGRTEDDDGKTAWSSRKSKHLMFSHVVRWHHEQVAYLLKRMSEIREGDGTLLDHSMIVYGSSLSDGHEHGSKNIPTLIAGRGSGIIRPGRSISHRRLTSMSRLYLSVLQGLGVNTDGFVDADEPLSDLG